MVSLDSVAELISKVLLAELIPKGNPWKHCTANALDVVTCPFICAGISVLQMGYLRGTPTDACAVAKKLCESHASWTPHPQASLKVHVLRK